MILHGQEEAAARVELRAVIESMCERVSPSADVVGRADAAAAGKRDERCGSDSTRARRRRAAAPEEWGGAGATFAETAVLLEAAGRRLATLPLLGSLLAVEALVRVGDRAAAERWVPSLVGGEPLAAWPEPADGLRAAGGPGPVGCSTGPRPGPRRARGRPDAGAGGTEEGLGWFAVAAGRGSGRPPTRAWT